MGGLGLIMQADADAVRRQNGEEWRESDDADGMARLLGGRYHQGVMERGKAFPWVKYFSFRGRIVECCLLFLICSCSLISAFRYLLSLPLNDMYHVIVT